MDDRINDKIEEYVNAIQYERTMWVEKARAQVANDLARSNHDTAAQRAWRARQGLDALILEVYNLNNYDVLIDSRANADGGGVEK